MGYDPTIGLLGAAVLVALLVMTMRRLHRSMRVFMPRPDDVPPGADYGLLVIVATVPTRDDAEMLRDVLGRHGIRATVASAGHRGSSHVLVFPDDANRARDVVATR